MSESVRRPRLYVVERTKPLAGDAGAGLADVADRASTRRDPPAEAREAALPPTVAEAALRQRYYEQQTASRRLADNVNRLRYAVVDLAAIDLPPSQLLDALSPTFDRPVIGDRLEDAIECLTRFVEEWHRRGAKRPPGAS